MSVSDKLNELRGQHWRHQNNLSRIRPLAPSSSLFARSSLPRDLVSGPDFSSPHLSTSKQKLCPGPSPPKSWLVSQFAGGPQDYQSPTWRALALSPLLSQLSKLDSYSERHDRVPSLVRLSLQTILTRFPSDIEEIVSFFPPHLRLLFTRHCAVHDPSQLPLIETLTERFVLPPRTVGPNTFKSAHTGTEILTEPKTWDSEDDPLEDSVYCIVVANTRISPSPTLFFPPTLTHLALLHVNGPLPLHRLLVKVPLLVFLDLSYNDWLVTVDLVGQAFERIVWSRLKELHTLGMRLCASLSEDMMTKLNESKWNPVVVIYEDTEQPESKS
ncbi:hypothetical protein DL96DRAFT_1577981 [Flagelloscypha sp. PMI_526]|nr:hypothetical protein DL96DRAFT_1577981 [Flagelloscypha sp. PMI_526]